LCYRLTDYTDYTNIGQFMTPLLPYELLT